MNHPAFSPHAASNATVGARNAASSPSSSSSSQPGRRSPSSLPAFSAYGIELEFMIVERGLLGWSNELEQQDNENKNQAPSASLAKLVPAFQNEVRYINRLLELYGARLKPTAMHPWMDPRRETRLWPHV